MATEEPKSHTVFEVYCRECEWRGPDGVDLKGTANVIAGRHISQTGHVVALKRVETVLDEEVSADDFYRGGRSVTIELLRETEGTEPATEGAANVRRCGPVECLVELQ